MAPGGRVAGSLRGARGGAELRICGGAAAGDISGRSGPGQLRTIPCTPI